MLESLPATRERDMHHALLIALTNPTSSAQLASFLRWYEHVQIPAFLNKLPGTKRAIRYQAWEQPPARRLPERQEYLALYDLEFLRAEDLSVYVKRQMQARLNNDIGQGSPGGEVLCRSSARGAYYEKISERQASKNSAPDVVIMCYTDASDDESEHDFIRWHATDKPFAEAERLAAPSQVTRYRIATLSDITLDNVLSNWIVPSKFLSVYEFTSMGDQALRDTIKAMLAEIDTWPRFVNASYTYIQAYKRISLPQTSC